MAWQDYADKHINAPVVILEIDFNSGTRYYGYDYIRTSTQLHKGKVLSISHALSSIGDLARTFERNRISIVMDDADYEFRGLEDSESPNLKNIVLRIKVLFEDDSYASSLTVFTGQIYDWERLDHLQFKIDAVQSTIDLSAPYPTKKVEIADYANAADSAIDQIIPIPYGAVSNYGLAGNGAWPALMVDTTVDSEKHLVGLQTAAITVDRVYLNGTLKTLTTHYTISTQVIDGMTHTLINWVAGVNPTSSDVVSCDVTFGSRKPVEAIKHIFENHFGESSGNFNTTSYDAARDIEDDRGYNFAGGMTTQKSISQWKDEWCAELELDIFWNAENKIMFNYASAVQSSGANVYTDVLDIIASGNRSDPQVTELVNYIDYSYSYDFARNYSYSHGVEEDTQSQTKYDGTYKDTVTFKWIRSAVMAADIAARKILRLKDPITYDNYALPLSSFSQALADAIKITHFEGRGSSGYDERVFQIRAMDFNLDRFLNNILVEDTEDYMGSYCKLGDESALAANWGAASAADKDYWYVCDRATGQFSGGDRGKQLFD